MLGDAKYNPYQAPLAAVERRRAIVSRAPMVPTAIRAREVLKTTLRVHSAFLWKGVAGAVVVYAVGSLCPLAFVVVLEFIATREPINNTPVAIALLVGVNSLNVFVLFLLLFGGLRFGLKAARGVEPRLADLLITKATATAFVRVWLAALFLIFPAFLFAVVALFALRNSESIAAIVALSVCAEAVLYGTVASLAVAFPLIVDRGWPVRQALAGAWQLGRGNRVTLLLVPVAALFVAASGLLVFGIGVWLTLPYLLFYVLPVTYLRITGQPVTGDTDVLEDEIAVETETDRLH